MSKKEPLSAAFMASGACRFFAFVLAALGPLPAAAQALRTPFGTAADGQQVDRYVLEGPNIRVGILTLGGIVDEIRVPDRHGRPGSVVLALPDVAAYQKFGNFAAIIGRYANRISHGGFSIDGQRYPLSPDPKAVVIHGGHPGFADRVWSATPCATPHCASLTLRYSSPDGESGFPGAVAVTVRYSLEGTALRIDYQATTTRPTVINLTNHSYFNLSARTAPTTADTEIMIPADRYTPIDARGTPTGEIRPVAGSLLDLRKPVRIADRWNGDDPQIALGHGFDHNYVLKTANSTALVTAAQAFDPISGRTLKVQTTEPGVQFYSGNYLNGRQLDRSGAPLPRGAGFALETQHFPDSPNHPEYPTTLLRPGETFRSTTIYRFGVRAG